MNTMLRVAFAAILLVPLAGQAASSDLANMVQAEYDFAAAAKREGYKASFLKFLSEDAVMFGNGPVPGRKRVAERPDLPGLLEWYPDYAIVANTGDVGFSTGPWVYSNEGKPSAFGHFFSIWRKQSDGKWLNALDLGVDHDEQKPAPERLQVTAAAGHAAAPSDRTKDIRDAETRFAKLASASGYAAAAESMAHPNLRVYRGGHAPQAGASQALPLLKEQNATATPTLDYASGSGDFGYAYGSIAKRSFVHVWKQDAGKWQLLADILTPVPEPPKAQ